MFAGLHGRRPEIRPQRLEKWALVPLSHAIEDEYLASGGAACWRAAFSVRSSTVASSGAGASSLASPMQASSPAFARFVVRPRRRSSPGRPADPSAREWALVCDAPGVHYLPGRDRGGGPSAVGPPPPEFDVIWSFDPATVRGAAEFVIGIVAVRAPRCETTLRAAIEHRPGPGPTATALPACERMVGYLARGAPDRTG